MAEAVSPLRFLCVRSLESLKWESLVEIGSLVVVLRILFRDQTLGAQELRAAGKVDSCPDLPGSVQTRLR
jgi:hypothetical protein